MIDRKWYVSALIVAAIVVLSVVAIAGFKPLIDVMAWEQQCGELVTEDGGFSGQSAISSGSGFSSVVCNNLSSNVVYFGGSTVSAAAGYPICTTSSCAAKTISLDTYGSQTYCATAANLDGGYQPVRCLAGR